MKNQSTERVPGCLWRRRTDATGTRRFFLLLDAAPAPCQQPTFLDRRLESDEALPRVAGEYPGQDRCQQPRQPLIDTPGKDESELVAVVIPELTMRSVIPIIPRYTGTDISKKTFAYGGNF